MSLMNMTFRSRLTVSYTLVLAGLLAVASAVLIVTMRNSAERRLDATLWVLGTSEAQSMVARLRDRNLRDPDDLSVFDLDYPEFSGYEEFRTQKYVTVVNAERRVIDRRELGDAGYDDRQPGRHHLEQREGHPLAP